MENFRKLFISLAEEVFDTVVRKNDLGDYGGVRFKPVNLVRFQDFSEALLELYTKGNISRQSLDEYYGYNWEEEATKRSEEKEVLNNLGLEGYEEQPFDKKNNQDLDQNGPETDEND